MKYPKINDGLDLGGNLLIALALPMAVVMIIITLF
jgi:hypothetical protein